jgi:hypothetical protein
MWFSPMHLSWLARSRVELRPERIRVAAIVVLDGCTSCGVRYGGPHGPSRSPPYHCARSPLGLRFVAVTMINVASGNTAN